jgi:hypothetical protein
MLCHGRERRVTLESWNLQARTQQDKGGKHTNVILQTTRKFVFRLCLS